MGFKEVASRKPHRCYRCTSYISAGTQAYVYKYLDYYAWRTAYYCSDCKEALAPAPTEVS